MKAFYLLLSHIIVIIAWQNSFAQSVTPLTSADRKNYILKIDEKEITKHSTLRRKNHPVQTSWSVVIKLINNSNDTLRYLTMSCSWYDNFRLDNKNIDIMGWGCDNNFTIVKHVPPHKVVLFVITVICADGLARSDTHFRMGMIIVKKDNEDQFLDFLNDGKNSKRYERNLIWSNQIEIPK